MLKFHLISILIVVDLTQNATLEQNNGLAAGQRKNVAKRTGGAPKTREVHDENNDESMALVCRTHLIYKQQLTSSYI